MKKILSLLVAINFLTTFNFYNTISCVSPPQDNFILDDDVINYQIILNSVTTLDDLPHLMSEDIFKSKDNLSDVVIFDSSVKNDKHLYVSNLNLLKTDYDIRSPEKNTFYTGYELEYTLESCGHNLKWGKQKVYNNVFYKFNDNEYNDFSNNVFNNISNDLVNKKLDQINDIAINDLEKSLIFKDFFNAFSGYLNKKSFSLSINDIQWIDNSDLCFSSDLIKIKFENKSKILPNIKLKNTFIKNIDVKINNKSYKFKNKNEPLKNGSDKIDIKYWKNMNLFSYDPEDSDVFEKRDKILTNFVCLKIILKDIMFSKNDILQEQFKIFKISNSDVDDILNLFNNYSLVLRTCVNKYDPNYSEYILNNLITTDTNFNEKEFSNFLSKIYGSSNKKIYLSLKLKEKTIGKTYLYNSNKDNINLNLPLQIIFK